MTLYGIEKADRDVKEFSDKAENILKSISDNEFLMDLLNYMVTRKK